MPAAFDKCRASSGSKIRTVSLKGNKYVHVCYDKAGKSHAGYVKTAKGKGK